MASITVPSDKLDKVLLDVEVLIEDVASLMNQDEIAFPTIPSIGVLPFVPDTWGKGV